MDNNADRFDVSPQQEKLWLEQPEGPTGAIQAVITLQGELEIDALRAALGRAVERHESLRTSFVREAGMRVPFQVVNDQLEPGWRTLDLAAEADPQTAKGFADAARQELATPFALTDGPLVRALLVRTGEDRQVLVLTLSELCADAASVSLLARELFDLYTGRGELVQDPVQYADFSAWQRELAGQPDDDDGLAARQYWGLLQSVTSPSLPYAKAPASATFVPDEIRIELGAASATPAVLHAAWHALLARLVAEDSVAVDLLSPPRRHADLAGAIGAFARPVPIRTQIESHTIFADVLRDIEQARRDASIWQDYAPDDAPPRLTVGFLDHDACREHTAELEFSMTELTTAGPQPRLCLVCATDDGGLAARICFDPACHPRESVERLARQLQRLLTAVSADPGVQVGAIELLDEAERRQLLVEFNATETPLVEACVHELIAARAAADPGRAAVIDEHGEISYAELDARANQLAHRLRAAGVGPDVTVGLGTDRSVEMIIGLLGILKAGGAYVPLHYEHPPARLDHQLTTAGARALVTQSGLRSRLPTFDGEIVCLDDDALASQPATPLEREVTQEHLVYVIYTSGSTGLPKGVGVTHRSLVNYATDIARALGADREPLTFALVSAISTDLGNTSVFGALCSGGTLVLISPAAAADATEFARQVQDVPIDVLKITPSHIGALLAMGDGRVLPRRWLVIGGERAPWDLLTRVRALSDCSIMNHYGPTEATVGCVRFHATDGPGPFAPATVPIGRPMANTSCYVLDDRRQPTPAGVPGRLFIGGVGVARGYVGAPELTSERFINDPFAGSNGGRMYDTGDRARWLPDGTLEFLGRTDQQIKIRGYRVEPAEVESALRSHPGVGEAVVVAEPTASGDARLVAYCTTPSAVEEAELRSHLAQWLPEFMLPSAIVALDALPRNQSGKIDLPALADAVSVAPRPATEYVEPRTPVEEVIAGIWSRTLGVPRISVRDDFFELGGHSLLAMQVVAQVRSDFAVDLPLHSLFTCPTVEALAAEIVRMMGQSEQDETAKLLAELEGLSDEEAERLLAARPPDAPHG